VPGPCRATPPARGALLGAGLLVALAGCSGGGSAGAAGPGGTAGTGGSAGGAATSATAAAPASGPAAAGATSGPAAGAGSGGAAGSGGPAPAVSVPAGRSGIVRGPATGRDGRPVVVADAGTVARAVQAVQRAAGAPQGRLLGVLGVGFTGGQGLLRVAVQDPANPAAGLEYTVDAAGAVVGPRQVPEGRLLKGFPPPATADRVAALGFTPDQVPLARLGDILAAAVTAGKLDGATVTTWNLTRERTDTSTDRTRLEWLVDLEAGPKDATVTLDAGGAVVEVDAG
jgi:hypothetical protein